MSQHAAFTRNGRSRPFGLALSLWVAVIALTASLGGSEARSDSASSTPKSPAKVKLTDANIAAIVVGANTIDVQNGQLALSKTQDPEVKAFANQMVADHTSVNKKATELVARLKVRPKESETSRILASGAATTRASLEAKAGAEFDRAYIENEVAYHQAVLDMLDEVLIPSARNKDLKSLLENVRPAFVAHLEHAKHIQATLGSP
jgi:putative membrane protein